MLDGMQQGLGFVCLDGACREIDGAVALCCALQRAGRYRRILCLLIHAVLWLCTTVDCITASCNMAFSALGF
jgi:hypothetical protein